jgi:hypothetical protein
MYSGALIRLEECVSSRMLSGATHVLCSQVRRIYISAALHFISFRCINSVYFVMSLFLCTCLLVSSIFLMSRFRSLDSSGLYL